LRNGKSNRWNSDVNNFREIRTGDLIDFTWFFLIVNSNYSYCLAMLGPKTRMAHLHGFLLVAEYNLSTSLMAKTKKLWRKMKKSSKMKSFLAKGKTLSQQQLTRVA
jgi:hypothetical protein